MSFGQAVALAAKVCFVLGAAVALIILAGCDNATASDTKGQLFAGPDVIRFVDDPETSARCYYRRAYNGISCVTTEY